MDNIGVANVVILKRPAVKKSHESAPVKVSGPQDFYPSPQLTKPAVRSIEHPLAQPESRKLERLNEKTIQRPSFSLPLPKDDDEMENSAAARDDSHGLSGALYPGQDKHIQLEEQDDGAHIQSVF